jgi:hypothetical protein
MEFASEMVVKACLNRQKITEIPIVLHPDGRDRPPHLRSFRDGWRHLRFLLLLCPLWLYLIPSLCLLGAGLILMAWLTSGPRMVGHVVFDVHTMLLGSLCLLLGNQTLWLWAYARTYGQSNRILPATPISERLLAWLSLERCLRLGAVLLFTGLALNVWLVWQWYRSNLGPLDVQTTLRFALWGFTAMVLGGQTIYGSFFFSMLGLAKSQASKE